jgi:hypothetical protein
MSQQAVNKHLRLLENLDLIFTATPKNLQVRRHLSHLPPGTGFLPPETDAPKEPQRRRPPAETEKPLEEIARNGRKSALLAPGL